MFIMYFAMDSVFNGIFVNIVENTYGYYLAWYFMQNKEVIILFICVTILVAEWLIIEMKAVGKLASVINQMSIIFNKDDNMIILDKQFKVIENNLNALKFDNIKNEQLAQVEIQRKNDLIAYLAHDIKTPLASVIGYLSLLDEVPDMPASQKAKYTRITLDKAYRLEQLVNEFFDITRFNLSTIQLEKENINLHLMLAQMVDEFYPMLTPGGRSVVLQVDENMTIYGDADKLARVFNNILKNAISYSYENSTITVASKQQDEIVIITFENMGKEIPPHKLNTIFEKFYRLDTARSSNTGGAGLGLAIAKEIVLAHNGTITVRSNEKSTVFSITIPVKL